MKDHIWKIIGIVAVLAIGGSIVYSNHVSGKANEGIVFADHIKGAENAKVTLTEYSDFQCPACGQFAGIVKEVLETYPDDVALEYKHYPLISIHPFAVPAAKAAEAAGQQGKFFEMHDKLFENQQVWSNSPNPNVHFIAYAESLELDMDLFKQHLKASKVEDKIQDEFRQARELGLTGTPSFFLDGERMLFESYEDFMAQIGAAVGADSVEVNTETAEPDVTFGL
jgi:protein-disulfide isomerase